MKKFKEIPTTMKELESIECDRCHKIFNRSDYEFEIEEMHCIHFTGGYDSLFGDGSHVECDLCQRCLNALIGDICRIDGKTRAEWDKLMQDEKCLLEESLYEPE